MIPPSATPVTAYIALGANLGDRATTIEAARAALDQAIGVRTVRCSALVETEAIGQPGQDPYLNGVTEIRTTLPPRDLLNLLLEIERSHGRVRHETDERWGPRTLDLDLILYGHLVLDEPGLTVPHPRMHERRFVLGPLASIAPGAVHPILNATAQQLLAQLNLSEPPISDPA